MTTDESTSQFKQYHMQDFFQPCFHHAPVIMMLFAQRASAANVYDATLGLYFAAALSKSALFSARSTRNSWLASAFLRRLSVELAG